MGLFHCKNLLIKKFIEVILKVYKKIIKKSVTNISWPFPSAQTLGVLLMQAFSWLLESLDTLTK